MAYKYAFKSASRIKADAQKVGEICRQLEETVGLTPQTLLDASRKKSAPLHDVFEWNDKKAAERYRLHQAGHIIRCLVVVNEEDKKEEIKLFHPVIVHTEDSEMKREYHSVGVIVENSNWYEEVKKNAFRELAAFQKKYDQLADDAQIRKIFDVIDMINRGETG